MKKILVLVTAVVIGLSASAATLDWSMTVASAAKGYQTMFFDYDNLAAVQGILDAGGASTYSSLQGYALHDSSSATAFATSGKSATKTAAFAGIDKGTDVFAVVFDTKLTGAIVDDMTYGMSGKFASSSYIYDMNADPPEASPGTFAFDLTSGLTAGTIGSGSSGGGGDTPSGVPEPTSGLLMLVGLGALALRRRR